MRFTREVKFQHPATFVITALAVMATAAPGTATATATELPPLPAGRLAFSTAVYASDASQSSFAVHGLGTMRLDGTDHQGLAAVGTRWVR